MLTVEQLIDKYPKIFQDYEGNPGRVNWLDLPDGWVEIIDDLCGCIQSRIDNVHNYGANPDYIEGSKYNRDDITTHAGIKIENLQVTCVQMKEKFGGLKFYVVEADNTIYGMINFAEYLADRTCQDCGSRKDIVTTSGWIRVLCHNCYTKNYEPKGIKLIKKQKEENEELAIN